MKHPTTKTMTCVAILTLFGLSHGAMAAASASASASASTAKTGAAQSVTAIKPVSGGWPSTLSANGSVAAWQEAVIGSQVNGLNLIDVRVNVGDSAKKGQILARFAPETVQADVAQAEAAREEARAALAEATSNADGARKVGNSGALSTQQITQYLTAERTAKARLKAAEAKFKAETVRLEQTDVVATDDGVISSRTATLGAVAGQGQELFRLIRQNRLEWRGEVPANDLLRIKPGQPVRLSLPNGNTLEGKVRMLAPTVDAGTRNGLVYVDLPASHVLRPGMFVAGQFELGMADSLSVPQVSVVARDGASHVFVIGSNGQVTQTKVVTGRRVADRVEIKSGLAANAQVVELGAGFLTNGDFVKIMPTTAKPASK